MTSSHHSKSKSAWQHLLKVPNREAMIKLCDQAILYKGLPADILPDLVVAEWSSILSVTKGETRQAMLSLSSLLDQAVFACSSDPAMVANTFPNDFHKDLQSLLSSIVVKKYPEWKTVLAASNVTHPHLVGVKCRVDNPSDHTSLEALPSSQADCVLQLKVENVGDGTGEAVKLIDVRLSKEKLNTMLDGLCKIKDQLTSVTQR